jgi:hypothetical protein
MSLNVIFREKMTLINNFLNDPTRVPSEDNLMEFLKNELFSLVEENDNDYSKIIKNMQMYKPDSDYRSIVIDHYNSMNQEFKDNIKFSLGIYEDI